MAHVLEFDLPYLPTLEAAEHDISCAEDECRTASDAMQGYGGTIPNMHEVERYKAARERLHKSRDLMRLARFRKWASKATGIWA